MPWNPFRSAADAGTSNSASSSTASSRPSPANRWKTTLEDEERYQALQYPDFHDVPTCMSLLDEMFSCYAAMPQMRFYYRYGTLANCSNKWQDYKFCLSLKSETEEERRQLWIKRRAEWWAKRRVERSSEDIWEVRKRVVHSRLAAVQLTRTREPPPDFPSLVQEGEEDQPANQAVV